MAAEEGKRFAGRFELKEAIGSGAMGKVYRAWDTNLERDVAIKVLSTEDAGQLEVAAKRFEQEAKVTAQLNHPNILKVFSRGFDEGHRPFIEMELVHGGSLHEFLNTRAPLLPSWTEIQDILKQLCAAVAHIHARGYVHRDLKPANLLLGHVGDYLELKVIDFGICVGMGTPQQARLTAVGMFTGTVPYIAPEVYLDDGRYLRGLTEQLDIYAVGVILYEMITGGLPFTYIAGYDNVYMTAVAQNEIPRPSSTGTREDVGPAVDKLMTKLLSKDPRERPTSIAEIPDLLGEALQSDRAQASARDAHSSSPLLGHGAILPPPTITAPTSGTWPSPSGTRIPLRSLFAVSASFLLVGFWSTYFYFKASAAETSPQVAHGSTPAGVVPEPGGPRLFHEDLVVATPTVAATATQAQAAPTAPAAMDTEAAPKVAQERRPLARSRRGLRAPSPAVTSAPVEPPPAPAELPRKPSLPSRVMTIVQISGPEAGGEGLELIKLDGAVVVDRDGKRRFESPAFLRLEVGTKHILRYKRRGTVGDGKDWRFTVKLTSDAVRPPL
jgi:serine/threonine protein kinase